MSLNRYPCGQFLPGEEPRDPPDDDPIFPPVYIPDPPPDRVVFDLPDRWTPPIPPLDPKWACIGDSPGDLYVRGGKRCVPCTGYSTNSDGIVTAIGEGERRCIHSSLAECARNCRSEKPRDGDIIPPDTGDERLFIKCVETIERCPPDPTDTFSGPDDPRLLNYPIKQILRDIVTCTFEEATNDFVESLGYPFDPEAAYPASPNGLSVANDFCVAAEITSSEFSSGCINSEILNNCIEEPSNNSTTITTSPDSFLAEGGEITNSVDIGDSVINSSIRINNFASVGERRTGDSRAEARRLLSSTPTKQANNLILRSGDYSRFLSASATENQLASLYNTTYNFFRSAPNDNLNLVQNSRRLDLFHTQIASELDYFLANSNTNIPWDEISFQAITNEKILLSLNRDLLTALRNTHNVINEPISINNFIQTLKSHIVAGTLNEFDVNYYYYVYNNQIEDDVVNIEILGETTQGIQTVMGMFNTLAKNADYRVYVQPSTKDEFKRRRFLLEDIQATIPSQYVNGESHQLRLSNYGALSQFLGSGTQMMDIGHGAGYYFNSETFDAGEVPLITKNELARARYLGMINRFQALKVLGVNTSLSLEASSLNQNNELVSSFDFSSNLYPMYFKLDLSSVVDLSSNSSILNPVTARYILIPEEEAQIHSRDYSYNITKVNLDHRDPIVRYAKDRGQIQITVNEFNLRGLGLTSTFQNEIMLRNMPAGIIITPGVGSFHNPYSGKSEIIDYGNTVVRRIYLNPSFDTNNTAFSRPPLRHTNTYNTLGTPYLGSYEKLFDQDLHGNIYTYTSSLEIFNMSYYSSGQYSNNQPSVEQREKSIESKLVVDLFDKLSSLSGVTQLTWWDIFRRVSLSDLGKLSFGGSNTLTRLLSNGWRNNVRVVNVVATNPPNYTGIPNGVTVPNDNIIINSGDRVGI